MCDVDNYSNYIMYIDDVPVTTKLKVNPNAMPPS